LPPIEENHLVLPGWEAAVRRSRCASVTQTMQNRSRPRRSRRRSR
jgi:hypothetical protein